MRDERNFVKRNLSESFGTEESEQHCYNITAMSLISKSFLLT